MNKQCWDFRRHGQLSLHIRASEKSRTHEIPLLESPSPTSPMSPPTWSQVAIAFLLVMVDWAILEVLRLGVGASLVISALRCGAQLIVVTLVLRCVFKAESMWAVVRLARRFLQYCCKSEWHTDGYQYF
jgi:Uncharacterised protein family (UPF0014)